MPKTANKSFLDRQRDAALDEIRQQAMERGRVSQIVLGADTRDRVTEVVRLGDDYVVEVTEPKGRILWTTVVNDEKSSRYHETQEEAVLHLIARRHDPDVHASAQAAYYAGRVLGTNRIPRDH